MPPKKILVIPGIIVGLDTFLKYQALTLEGGLWRLIPGWIEVNVLRNRGLLAGWGYDLHQNSVFFARAASLCILFGLFWYISRVEWIEKVRLGASLLIWGGGSNAVEGLARGYVTDYISIYRFPVINLADLMILTGISIIIFSLFRKLHAPHSI